jgi:hypothetical protein
MGRTGLSYACINGHEEIVKVLLQDDITDVATADKDGNSPLMFAAGCGRPSITSIVVNKLLQIGSPIDSRNALGYTPLLLACKSGHYVSAHILLTVGKASPLLRDNEFYLNALEWLKKGHKKRNKKSNNVLSRSMGSYRDNSYNPNNRLTKSLDSALSVSGDLNGYSWLRQQELLIDNQDAREVVIKLVTDALDSAEPRSSRIAGRVRFHDRPPPTAKLLAVRDQMPSNSVIPSMETIFSIYSDQFDQRSFIKRPSQGRAQKDFRGLHYLDPLVETSAEDVRYERHSIRSMPQAKV